MTQTASLKEFLSHLNTFDEGTEVTYRLHEDLFGVFISYHPVGYPRETVTSPAFNTLDELIDFLGGDNA